MSVIKTCALGVLLSSFMSCGSSGNTVNVSSDGSYQPNHGPFDENGNYREDWANKSPKRRVTRKKTPKKVVKKPTPTKRKIYTPSKPTPTTRKKYTPSTPTPSKRKKYTPPKRIPKKITPKTKPPVICVVKKGDTLWGLSQKYQSTAALIRKANNIKGNSISIGQRLIIPRK